MVRKFDGGKLVLASHNPGKVVEIAELLEPFGADLVSAGEMGLPEPEETGTTFIANAELKALAATKGSGFPALADDSGRADVGRRSRHLLGTMGRSQQKFPVGYAKG